MQSGTHPELTLSTTHLQGIPGQNMPHTFPTLVQPGQYIQHGRSVTDMIKRHCQCFWAQNNQLQANGSNMNGFQNVCEKANGMGRDCHSPNEWLQNRACIIRIPRGTCGDRGGTKGDSADQDIRNPEKGGRGTGMGTVPHIHVFIRGRK